MIFGINARILCMVFIVIGFVLFIYGIGTARERKQSGNIIARVVGIVVTWCTFAISLGVGLFTLLGIQNQNYWGLEILFPFWALFLIFGFWALFFVNKVKKTQKEEG